jgi:hypothetical protein
MVAQSESATLSMRSGMTPAELAELPVSFDLVTAGRAFAIGRTKAHQLARGGKFPCPVLRIGISYRVTRADLFHALGIEPAPQGRKPDAAA